jgi:tripartite-type tricarboxylate transporter receptor subunit TctC
MRWIKRWLACIALAVCTGSALAQSYPNRPIRFIVGFPPGGGNDLAARLVAAKLQESLGQPIIVENKPGADAIIATQYVAKAAPDGYTLLVGAPGHMVINMVMHPKLPYDTLRDFVPITVIGFFPVVLAVNPNLAVKSVRDLVALAKSQPGKLNYGAGSPVFYFATEMFKQTTGVDITHIPYKGSAQTVNAAVAGDVQVLFVDSAPVLPMLKAEKLRGLAVTTPHRSPLLPELPTMNEAGIPDYQMLVWSSLFAPSGTPQEIVSRLHREVAGIVQLADVKEKMTQLGIEPGGTRPEELATLIKSELARYRAVAKAANIKPQQ